MSNRHRTGEVVPDPLTRRVQVRSERHRVNTLLADVTGQILGGAEPDDVVEPGIGFRGERHRDPAKARPSARRRRHWKLKMWKRRTALRRAKAALERAVI
ncbi:MAG: hypothetical protein C0P77_000735 [Thermoanaerobacterales bacterium]|jgi:hypothetical protein|nr:hypothetical protein [Thermoanaerobacterales bacterium]